MSEVLPPEAYVAALAGLPGVGPARLSRLLDQGGARAAWQALASRSSSSSAGLAIAGSSDLFHQWVAVVSATDPWLIWERYQTSDVGVVGRDSPAFPERLRDDPEPPAALFTLGDPTLCAADTVAIVGTRRCTRYGIDLAYELGRLLADNGVSVVSGLAKGIDAAAHRGALDAGAAAPIAVVAGGLDIPYPRENKKLWEQVAAAGLIIAEAPLGQPPERWRFPARNRIVAGLAQVTIVVESHLKGGSLYTAAQALERERLVLAVPGSIRSAASGGCNRLIADGCHPLCEIDDALVALDLLGRNDPGPSEPVTPRELAVLDAAGWQPATFADILQGSGLGLESTASVVDALVSRGLLVPRGPFFERSPAILDPVGSNDPRTGHQERVRPRPES